MLESNDGTPLPKTGNADLTWDFREFEKRNVAREFIMHFENNLCIYSGTVSQLYSNYTIFFPRDENGRLVILPDPYSYHDTFQSISELAVKPTGLYIVPNMSSSENQMLLRIPIKTKSTPFRDVPLHVGLQVINQRRSSPLLPVVVKGDLREFDHKMPALHLHNISLEQLRFLSKLEIDNLTHVITKRLNNI